MAAYCYEVTLPTSFAARRSEEGIHESGDFVVARLTLRPGIHRHYVADSNCGHQCTFGEQRVFLVRKFGQQIGLREQCLVGRNGKGMDAGIGRIAVSECR